MTVTRRLALVREPDFDDRAHARRLGLQVHGVEVIAFERRAVELDPFGVAFGALQAVRRATHGVL